MDQGNEESIGSERSNLSGEHMNIFVGNLSFDTTEADLKKLFEEFGIVASVVIVMDEKGNKSRGFGFLEMAYSQQAEKAIAALDGRKFMGRLINVSQAQPKSEEAREIGDQKEIKKRIKAHKRKMSQYGKSTSPAGRRDFKKKGEFLGGRRTVHSASLPVAERRKQTKPWQKPEASAKPWGKRQAAAKSWTKAGVSTRPVKRTTGKSRPWQRRP